MSQKVKPWQATKNPKKQPKHAKMVPYNRCKASTK